MSLSSYNYSSSQESAGFVRVLQAQHSNVQVVKDKTQLKLHELANRTLFYVNTKDSQRQKNWKNNINQEFQFNVAQVEVLINTILESHTVTSQDQLKLQAVKSELIKLQTHIAGFKCKRQEGDIKTALDLIETASDLISYMEKYQLVEQGTARTFEEFSNQDNAIEACHLLKDVVLDQMKMSDVVLPLANKSDDASTSMLRYHQNKLKGFQEAVEDLQEDISTDLQRELEDLHRCANDSSPEIRQNAHIQILAIKEYLTSLNKHMQSNQELTEKLETQWKDRTGKESKVIASQYKEVRENLEQLQETVENYLAGFEKELQNVNTDKLPQISYLSDEWERLTDRRPKQWSILSSLNPFKYFSDAQSKRMKSMFLFGLMASPTTEYAKIKNLRETYGSQFRTTTSDKTTTSTTPDKTMDTIEKGLEPVDIPVASSAATKTVGIISTIFNYFRTPETHQPFVESQPVFESVPSIPKSILEATKQHTNALNKALDRATKLTKILENNSDLSKMHQEAVFLQKELLNTAIVTPSDQSQPSLLAQWMQRTDDLCHALKEFEKRISSIVDIPKEEVAETEIQLTDEEVRRISYKITAGATVGDHEEVNQLLDRNMFVLSSETLSEVLFYSGPHMPYRDTNLHAIKKITESGRVPYKNDNYWSVFRAVAEEGNLDLLKSLISALQKHNTLQEINPSLVEALKTASRRNQKDCVKFLCESIGLSTQNRAEALLGLNTLPSSEVMELLLKDQSSDVIDSALLRLTQQSTDGVKYLLDKYTFSQKIKNQALAVAIQQNKVTNADALVEKGAKHPINANYLEFLIKQDKLPEIPQKEWLTSPDTCYVTLITYLRHRPLTPEILKATIASQIPLSEDNLYSVLEVLMTYQEVDSEVIKPFLSSIMNFSQEHIFRLVRHELIYGYSSLLQTEMQTRGMTFDDKYQVQINQIKKDLAQKREEAADIKRQVLEGLKTSKIMKTREEREKSIRDAVESNKAEIKALLASGTPLSGVKYFNYNTGKIIAIIPSMPHLIIKAVPRSTSFDTGIEKAKRTDEALRICQENHLDRIQVPYSVAFDDFKNSKFPYEITVEERLDVIDDFNDFYRRVGIMNDDPELQPIIDEDLRQLSVFIAKFRLADLKPNNTPFLKNGNGFGIVDLDIQDDPLTSIYKLDNGRSLISMVHHRNFKIIRETVVAGGLADNKEAQYASYEHKQLKKINYLDAIKYKKRHGIINERDPIHYDENLLNALSVEDQVNAKKILKLLNHQLADNDYILSPLGYRVVVPPIPHADLYGDDFERLSELLAKKGIIAGFNSETAFQIFC